MRMQRLTLLLVALSACRSAGPGDASAVVENFYSATIASGATGAPTAETLARLRPYLSDTVAALLAAARARHDADFARAPDEKPAFTEGDLFSSLFEGPSEVKVLADSAAGPAHRVTAGMRHSGATPPVEWSDTVIVVAEHERLVIDDIRYGGKWELANTGSLRSSIVAALAAQ